MRVSPLDPFSPPTIFFSFRRSCGLQKCLFLYGCVQVKLYEVLRPFVTAPSAAAAAAAAGSHGNSDGDEDEDGLRLIHRRRVGALGRPGWEVFKVRHVVQRWVSDPSRNRGRSSAALYWPLNLRAAVLCAAFHVFLVRPSVRPSVCLFRACAFNSKTKR